MEANRITVETDETYHVADEATEATDATDAPQKNIHFTPWRRNRNALRPPVMEHLPADGPN
jgi:hypothetical protein